MSNIVAEMSAYVALVPIFVFFLRGRKRNNIFIPFVFHKNSKIRFVVVADRSVINFRAVFMQIFQVILVDIDESEFVF